MTLSRQIHTNQGIFLGRKLSVSLSFRSGGKYNSYFVILAPLRLSGYLFHHKVTKAQSFLVAMTLVLFPVNLRFRVEVKPCKSKMIAMSFRHQFFVFKCAFDAATCNIPNTIGFIINKFVVLFTET